MGLLKLIQPPYLIFSFCNCFCLLQSKQTFLKSSHLLSLFTFRAFNKKRFSLKCLRQICRGAATPNVLQRFYLFKGCDNSIALELKQVTQHIFGKKKIKNVIFSIGITPRVKTSIPKLQFTN